MLFQRLRYAEGARVMSGSRCLRCERGIWVEVGARDDARPAGSRPPVQ